MYLDAQNMFSKAQAITATAPSTNVIDLGVARDVGGAVTDQLYLLCEVVTAFTSGGGTTLQVQYQGSNDASSWTTIAQSDAVALASLAQGYKFLQGPTISPVSGSPYRYLRLNYVVASGPFTGGAITAAFTPSLQHQPVYAAGYVA